MISIVMKLQVIVFVCDGGKPNRQFLNEIGSVDDIKEGVVYKTINRYALHAASTSCQMYHTLSKPRAIAGILPKVLVLVTCG